MGRYVGVLTIQQIGKRSVLINTVPQQQQIFVHLITSDNTLVNGMVMTPVSMVMTLVSMVRYSLPAGEK